MVQLLADPALPQAGTLIQETAEGRSSMAAKNEGVMSREEHAQRVNELNMKRNLTRPPRRGWSMTEHRAEHDTLHHAHGAASLVDHQASIPENGPLPTPATPPSTATPGQNAQIPQRPKLPPPRRSYSVTDKEPEPVAPGQPRPSSRMTILDLPSEMHYDLFDLLDPIDGVCLGLAHSKLYAIHRRKYGKVPLCSRYAGPNDMEWAWRGAGPLIRPSRQTDNGKGSRLDQLRVRGQVYCRKCGISRCELHRHLKSWMGDGYEYCEITKMYGKPAGQDAKNYCFMKSPKNPHRCGRHGGKKSVIVAEESAPRRLAEVAEKK
ncbi:F-box domain-containing protein [Hirsutella rhossiliensis]|uniref:F-box domain-containing protein n=1 Tax=Hirsutella rhossiliensis TaxID=111463 RepID=A0A9P8MNI8_9HYPO|nr:F-box domain-containing protein [Hirsutella rhossiliensis]KAH0958335.1 F-box domain-containing protein [Hirsutella rhossiliensis]